MRGRRKPTALKLLQGNPGKEKLPEREPKPTEGAPRRPRGLSKLAGEEWARLVERCLAMRVLTEVDDRMLEITARAYAEYDELSKIVAEHGYTYETNTKNGHRVVARPEVKLAADAWRRYERGLTHFGLSPSTRAKVQTVGNPGDKPRKIDKYVVR